MSLKKDRSPAAKTTIVGGQPPGNERQPANIPVALEELLGLAAAEPAFTDALLDDPQAAARAAGVALTATEGAILTAVDRDSLFRMIAEVREQQPEQERRAFLEQAALALTALVGGGAVAAGCNDKSKGTGGRRPERRSADTGARPDRPSKSEDAGATHHGAGRTIRPDRHRPLRPLPKVTGIRPRPHKKPDR